MARLAGRNLKLRKQLQITARSVAAANAVASVGVPTKVEFDAVVTLVNEIKADHNALVADLKA